MVHVWAIADLHLSFSVPNKSMEVFGPSWSNWTAKIKENWCRFIQSEDLVLIPGDISWALRTEEARPDLEWIDQLPGKKVFIRGNHDYWWESQSKVKQILPPSCHIIQNNSFYWNGIAIAGARLWDSSEYNFSSYIDFQDNPHVKKLATEDRLADNDKIFKRELIRLETSLKSMNQAATSRIVMTHYPPISSDLNDSLASTLFEKYQVNISVFGHLHNIMEGKQLFGSRNGIRYILTSADYLDFMPLKIV